MTYHWPPDMAAPIETCMDVSIWTVVPVSHLLVADVQHLVGGAHAGVGDDVGGGAGQHGVLEVGGAHGGTVTQHDGGSTWVQQSRERGLSVRC